MELFQQFVNVSAPIARKVYDDFINKKLQTVNEKLCAIRKAFDDTGNLVSALHSFMAIEMKNIRDYYLL